MRINTPRRQTAAGLILLAACVVTADQSWAAKKAPLEIPIYYFRFVPEAKPLLSNLTPPPKNSGQAGAELAIQDSNTTGRFTGQHYQLTSQQFTDIAALEQSLNEQIKTNSLVLLDAPISVLKTANQFAQQRNALIFNVGNADDELRTKTCLNNTLHTYPSRAMLTDALAQWLAVRRFNRWFLVEGQTAEDQAYSTALHRSAKRFGSKIVAQKQWTFATDLRRTAQSELPLFTQGPEYDVVMVADEAGDFGHFLPYNTWLPRPVVGTQGLSATAWSGVVEQWGAAQLQSRFNKLHQRKMNDRDYAAWVAVRAIAEAVTQGKQTQATGLKTYLLDEQFHLAAFKGHKLTFRAWNGQLRQPIPLVQPESLVSQSPQAGYLHPVTELDTLGFDRTESQCQLTQSQ
ncbi:ABC transporter, substrate binding protein, PQQ-dependent alcohol dehydrogenase system [Oceanospirillum multiglobuliferum]|uniref:Branched-chain amino acid ABC transporter substrate-binding protein n=1 Tax=Oceanospirillum multiglobuliferum TaxID=64969 RepID=A0A1T4PIA2_9GAMM|nr:ABC transporter substrate-binding protein [Oceanospirillum multiglobuliferum]OPX55544.1 branched-chain amino acid ABC transporter substrate-binding protein [Oceanospirillum multiglobuliferum]SJZ90936.1 ABC transporter, substrate binding protein, PQQ-dependent alcohol dehydrogenase system [Oceanospirillum multiglobuliferum]